MKTPVIIPAYNEAERIGKTLNSLSSDTCEPFVIVNGIEGSAQTVAEAEKYTNNVFVAEEQGRMPAIQLALRILHDRSEDALSQPILFTDADTQVLDSRKWVNELGGAVEGSIPKSAGGLVFYNEGPLVDRALRNALRFLRAKTMPRENFDLDILFGPNMALNFANNHDIVERVIDAPHIWPGEDRYLAHVVAEDDPNRFSQLATLGSAVLTSARHHERLFGRPLSREERIKTTHEHYIARKAIGATHLFDADSLQLTAYDK